MADTVKQKTVWITGASGGIGSAVASLFAQNQYRLVLQYYRGEERMAALEADLRKQGTPLLVRQADMRDPAQAEDLAEAARERFGGVDVLVYCAGLAQQKLFQDITQADYERMFDLHVRGLFRACQCIVPDMLRRKRGKIIALSSVWGIQGASCEVHYSAAKAAVIGFTKALARELAPSQIQVNCIAPGVIDTPMNAALPEQTRTLLLEESPMGRFGRPEEVADLALFLAGEQADFITGQVIGIDGGFI